MAEPGSKIELNTATAAEIAGMPGMSARLAARILRHRQRYGPFQKLADLHAVRGIALETKEQLAEIAYVDELSARERITFARGEHVPAEFAFFGIPGAMHGRIALANEGAHPVHVAAVAAQNHSLRDAAGKALREFRIGAHLEPGEQMHREISFALDPTTPPGVYPAEVVVGGERRGAMFHVAEHIDTSITPQELVIFDGPGARVEKTVFVTNRGNVALADHGMGPIVLEQDLLFCRMMRNAVHDVQNPSWDAFVGAASEELKKAYDEAAPVKLSIERRPDVVRPGETGIFVLVLQLPKSLLPRHSYRGICRLFDTAVAIVINPIGGQSAESVSDSPSTAGKGRGRR